MSSDATDPVAAVLAGDLERYRELVLRYEPEVWRRAAFVLRDRAAAEDVTQEAFLVAYRKLDEYDPARPFGAWLAGIARNLLRNELR
ncbi:MAG: sigma-70 family RNA polymerase sigma factor, partial [Planctomycetota bacterium]